jgi:hypothetical protein
LSGCSQEKPPQTANWVELFDGKTLNGWKQSGGEAKYTVENGVIVGTAIPKTHNSFLTTEKHYSDFILELEFKIDPLMNSGIQIRSHEFKEGDPQPEDRKKDLKPGRVFGYQVEIDPSDRAWSAGLYEEGRRGWLQNLENNPEARKAFKQNQWNHYRIEAIGNRIRTWINGVPAADLHDDMSASGFIGLQVHGTGNKQVRLRRIRIQQKSQNSAERAKSN